MMQVELRVLSGKQAGTVIPLPVGKFLVGREQDCHLRPNSELVSRHHCAFTLDDFALRIRDLGSTNGTLVNGERIRGTVVLKPGDQVSIGKIDFLVAIDGEAGAMNDTMIGQRDDTIIHERPKSTEPVVSDSGLDLSEMGSALAELEDDTRVGSGTVSNDPAVEEATVETGAPMVAANADTQQIPMGVPDPAMAGAYPQFAAPPPWMSAPQYPYPPMPYPGYPAMPYAPGYPYPGMGAPGMPGMPGAMPPGYGYAMPAPAPAPEAPAPAAPAPKPATGVPEVRLPDPSTTGAKEAPPAPPKPANPDDKAKPAAHIPTAAQSIINSMMQRRPKTE